MNIKNDLQLMGIYGNDHRKSVAPSLTARFVSLGHLFLANAGKTFKGTFTCCRKFLQQLHKNLQRQVHTKSSESVCKFSCLRHNEKSSYSTTPPPPWWHTSVPPPTLQLNTSLHLESIYINS